MFIAWYNLSMSIHLEITKRTDERLLELMSVHYSKPKGFVGRNICYAILCDGKYYGHIVGGSATLHLPGRYEFFEVGDGKLNNIVNNIFYHLVRVDGKYPMRNFSVAVLNKFEEVIVMDWEKKYGDIVIGFESLVELPRTGELYRRAGWTEVGITKGYTCKRVSGKGTDSWSGKRVWNYQKLRPKIVFCKRRS